MKPNDCAHEPNTELYNMRSHHKEKPACCNKKEPPLTATRESLNAATKTHHRQKQKMNRSF